MYPSWVQFQELITTRNHLSIFSRNSNMFEIDILCAENGRNSENVISNLLNIFEKNFLSAKVPKLTKYNENYQCRQFAFCINKDQSCSSSVILVPPSANLYTRIRTVYHFFGVLDVMMLRQNNWQKTTVSPS